MAAVEEALTRLGMLAGLLQGGVITPEEYELRRVELLNKMTKTVWVSPAMQFAPQTQFGGAPPPAMAAEYPPMGGGYGEEYGNDYGSGYNDGYIDGMHEWKNKHKNTKTKQKTLTFDVPMLTHSLSTHGHTTDGTTHTPTAGMCGVGSQWMSVRVNE